MNRRLNIMIIEDDTTVCKHFTEYIEQYDDLSITTITNNSYRAIELLQEQLPEAIILDLELNEGKGNGLLFLQEMKRQSLPFKPYILVTTNNSSAITHDYVRQLGADFIMSKHQEDYSEHTALDFLQMMRDIILNQHISSVEEPLPKETTIQKEKRLKRMVNIELDRIGISPKMIGFTYLTEAILLVLDGQNNNLCTTIGLKHAKTDSSVERAMQNAIKSAWRNTDIDDLLQNYTARINPDRGVPTLTEFIYYYANKIENSME